VVEYRHAIDLKPDYMLAHFNLGLTMERLGDKRRAAEEFRLCKQLEPQSHNDADTRERAIAKLKALETHG
jgi:predicted TPR repeat methyltransferase